MSTLAIVLLSMLGGLLVGGLIAMAGYLIWQGRNLRSVLVATQETTKTAISELALLKTDIRSTLESHAKSMEVQVGRINGDKLSEAASQGIAASRRIETAAVALGELVQSLLSEDAIAALKGEGKGLGPEEYAPPDGTRHVSQNRTGAGDAEELAGGGEQEP